MAPENGIPLYLRIAEDIKNQIVEGKWKTGDKIPSEKSLMEHYSTSRVTIRKALGELVDSKYLESIPYKGKYIIHFNDTQKNTLHSLHKSLLQQGRNPYSKILSMVTMETTAEQAELMHCREGEPLMVIERLRFVDDIPFCHAVITLRTGLLKSEFNPWELTHRSLHDVFEQDFGLRLAYSRQSVQACLPTEYQRDLLKLSDEATPLIRIKNTLSLENGEVIEYSDGCFVTEIVPLDFAWSKNGPQPL